METLIALMVICLGLVMLPGAIVTAARINDEVAKQQVFLGTDETLQEDEEISVRYTGSTAGVGLGVSDPLVAENLHLAVYKDLDVNMYSDGNFRFFRAKAAGGGQ